MNQSPSYYRLGKNGRRLIVMLHGWLGTSEDWRPTADKLVPADDVLCLDLPGHGHSQSCADEMWTMHGLADAVMAIATREAAGRPIVLVGYSMGGRVAMVAGARHPQTVAGCVVVSASPGIRDDERKNRLAWEADLASRVRTTDPATFVDEWYREPFFGDIAQSSLYRAIKQSRLANWHRDGLARAAESLGVGHQPHVTADLARAPWPVWMMVGECDKKYLDIARDFHQKVATSRVCVVPDAGHAVHLERPDEWMAYLTTYLTEEV